MKMRRCLAVTLTFFTSFAVSHGQTWNHNPTATNGPLSWGGVAPTYATCGAKAGENFVSVGMKATPIDIETTKAMSVPLPALKFHYEPTPFEIENNGHVIEVPYEKGSTLTIGGSATDVYELAQFHFHAPSEHTVDGKPYDAEFHLVHRNILGELAVVGVFMQRGDGANGFFDQIMAGAPARIGVTPSEGTKINAAELLPPAQSYFTYTGSLTTPPCTEGVRWFVLNDPVAISDFALRQIHILVSQFPGYNGFPNNNRPVMPLNGRGVVAVK
jgi:carbonic anhydrase